jgi:Cyclin, N-terminal domain/Cyclin, C-terminal domain
MPALSLQTTPLEDALLPRLDASEIADRIKAMKKQEKTTYECTDYLKDNEKRLRKSRKAVDEDCRVKMCEWCYQVVDFCKFRRETVSISMSYLDRYLGTKKGRHALMDRKDYQLAAMTALYMAIKLHEPLEMETSLLADLSRGCYNELEITKMEQSILDGLNWRMQGPTALAFVQHFLAFLPEDINPAVATALMDYSRFQTELASTDYSLVTRPPSRIALAAVLNAVEGMDQSRLSLRQQGSFLRMLEKFSGMLREDVEETQAELNDILLDVYAVDVPEHDPRPLSINYLSPVESAHRDGGEKSSRRKSSKRHTSKCKSPSCVARE